MDDAASKVTCRPGTDYIVYWLLFAAFILVVSAVLWKNPHVGMRLGGAAGAVLAIVVTARLTRLRTSFTDEGVETTNWFGGRAALWSEIRTFGYSGAGTPLTRAASFVRLAYRDVGGTAVALCGTAGCSEDVMTRAHEMCMRFAPEASGEFDPSSFRRRTWLSGR